MSILTFIYNLFGMLALVGAMVSIAVIILFVLFPMFWDWFEED